MTPPQRSVSVCIWSPKKSIPLPRLQNNYIWLIGEKISWMCCTICIAVPQPFFTPGGYWFVVKPTSHTVNVVFLFFFYSSTLPLPWTITCIPSMLQCVMCMICTVLIKSFLYKHLPWKLLLFINGIKSIYIEKKKTFFIFILHS